MHRFIALTVLLVIAAIGASSQVVDKKAPSRTLPVEVLQVVELPLNVHDVALVQADKGYVLKCRLSNSTPVTLLGLRYSLTGIDGINGTRPVENRIEGLELSAYGTKTIVFSTLLRVKPRQGNRFVFMLEQVISRDSIWEVIKSKDALERYVEGDYSVLPQVMRVANQVDAPLQIRLIY